MIRHVVMWRLASSEESEREEQLSVVKQGLESLPPLIPAIRAFEVGINALKPGDNFDIVLVSDFDDEAGLESYVVHPEHEKVAAYIRSVVAGRSAVDFLI